MFGHYRCSFSLLHPRLWEMSDPFASQIVSLIHVPGMKGLKPDGLELIILIQDYGGCRRRLLCLPDLPDWEETVVVLTGDLDLAVPGWEGELQAGLSWSLCQDVGLRWRDQSGRGFPAALCPGGSLGHCGWKGGWKGQETHVDRPLSPTISCLRHCCFLRAKHLRGEPPRKGPQDSPPGLVVLQTTWPKT